MNKFDRQNKQNNHVLLGMHAVLNNENIKSEINLKDLEKQLIEDGLISEIQNNPIQQQNIDEELKKVTDSIGMTQMKQEHELFARDDTLSDKVNNIVKSDSLEDRTREQEKRAHIENIMGTDTGFSFEKEKREDVKIVMLSEIDDLLNTLSDEIDVSRIPTVDITNTFEEIESLLKHLRHKNDTQRYCTLANECILFVVYSMEDLFDGKRMWFNRYRPDLTGWNKSVKVKLKRMRHDTGLVVNNMLSGLGIGPITRILAELIPSMVLYANSRKQQNLIPNISFTEEDINAAREHIRSFE